VKRKERNNTALRDAQNRPFFIIRQIVKTYSGFLKCAQCFVSALALFFKLLSFLYERSKIYLKYIIFSNKVSIMGRYLQKQFEKLL
jgi:hypothetical protein